MSDNAFTFCEHRTFVVKRQLTYEELLLLFEAIYRTGYRGYIPDFELLSDQEREIFDTLRAGLVDTAPGYGSNLVVLVGNRIITIWSFGNLYSENSYQLPFLPEPL